MSKLFIYKNSDICENVSFANYLPKFANYLPKFVNYLPEFVNYLPEFAKMAKFAKMIKFANICHFSQNLPKNRGREFPEGQV